VKEYNVLLSLKANDDMDDIYTYIAETLLAPDTAAKQYDRIADAILSLEIMPMRISLMPSEPEHSRGVRAMYVDNYTVFFVVKPDTVYIMRVLYSASDISGKLLDGEHT